MNTLAKWMDPGITVSLTFEITLESIDQEVPTAL